VNQRFVNKCCVNKRCVNERCAVRVGRAGGRQGIQPASRAIRMASTRLRALSFITMVVR